MAREYENPFEELPEALVSDLLAQSEDVGNIIYESFQDVQTQRNQFRSELQRANLLRRDSELGYPDIPTSCGVDGSFAIERLLSTDLLATAAVAIEGLTPPSETRYWERPHHSSMVQPVEHHEDTGTIVRAIMIGYELRLAAQAPHDVVFLDGSLTTPLIYLNQALNKIRRYPNRQLVEVLKQGIQSFLSAYSSILSSARTDHLWCGVPKYTVRRELGARFNWPDSYDDRALLTHVLVPGEFIAPMLLEQPSAPWHINLGPLESAQVLESMSDEIISALARLYIIYYRPHDWVPALRVEIASSIAENNNRLAELFQALKHQCATPSILEPYPLYMADRMAKHLGKAIPALRQVATQQMVTRYSGQIDDIFFSMHGYRTESGR